MRWIRGIHIPSLSPPSSGMAPSRLIGICNLNHNVGTGKYHPADIDNLMEQQRLEHITMLRVMDGLKAHTETVQPPLQETEP